MMQRVISNMSSFQQCLCRFSDETQCLFMCPLDERPYMYIIIYYYLVIFIVLLFSISTMLNRKVQIEI